MSISRPNYIRRALTDWCGKKTPYGIETKSSVESRLNSFLPAKTGSQDIDHVSPKILPFDSMEKRKDNEVAEKWLKANLPTYALESVLGNAEQAVRVRRTILSRLHSLSNPAGRFEMSQLPYEKYDWERVSGACCENVIGFMPVPVGLIGPLTLDGMPYYVPMATTEGALVASTSRGCKAVNVAGGITTVLHDNGISRAPCVAFPNITRANIAKRWLESKEGLSTMRLVFESTSRFAKLQTVKCALAGVRLYIRFSATTGDAMGMNMISKAVEKVLETMVNEEGFQDMHLVSISGNYCSDKKPAAVNWIEGRGKSVTAEAVIDEKTVSEVLKSDINSLVEVGFSKNMIGSAVAGSIGGFNAHAANVVAALFIATGQDPAQVVGSASCITTLENVNGALRITVSMPSLEVGTVGGGTILEPQKAMLDLLNANGTIDFSPGDRACRLARIICATVLAGELSLCAALSSGHLVKAHMSHNRKKN